MGADDQDVEARITGTGSGRAPASGRAFRAGTAAARSAAGLPGEQRRARRIAMSRMELDAFLTKQRTCRVATASQDGPHLTPLWYVWDGTALWLYSVVRSQRWTDISRDRRVAVLVDAGDAYGELRGAELRGAIEIVGEVPRTGTPDARLAEPERLYARKYEGTGVMYHTGHHAWLRLVPGKITSWDFRKKVSVEDYDFG
jgi:Pyridoxamine 5'-phosphate oxidase